jgi:hypothetical protein
VQPPVGQSVEQVREAPGDPRRLDPFVGRVLGHVQLTDAIGIHGGIRRREIQLARVHLGDMGHHLGGGGALAGDQRVEIPEQGGVGLLSQREAGHRDTSTGAGVEGITGGGPPHHLMRVSGARG